LEDQGRQNPLHRGGTHGQNLSAAFHQLRQVPHAVVREAPKLSLLSPLAGDGDARVPGQRGEKSGGDPTGANRGRPRAAPAARFPSAAPAGWAPKGQSACAISALNSVTYLRHQQSPDWTAAHAPTARCSLAARFVAGFSPLAARLLRP